MRVRWVKWGIVSVVCWAWRDDCYIFRNVVSQLLSTWQLTVSHRGNCLHHESANVTEISCPPRPGVWEEPGLAWIISSGRISLPTIISMCLAALYLYCSLLYPLWDRRNFLHSIYIYIYDLLWFLPKCQKCLDAFPPGPSLTPYLEVLAVIASFCHFYSWNWSSPFALLPTSHPLPHPFFPAT